MPENAEFSKVVHVTVAGSKEIAEVLTDAIAKSKDGKVTLSVTQLQAVASQLRITANLCEGFLDETTTLHTRINELVDRVHKPE